MRTRAGRPLCTTDRGSAIFKDRLRPQAFNLKPDRRSRLYACGTPVRRFAQSRHHARGHQRVGNSGDDEYSFGEIQSSKIPDGRTIEVLRRATTVYKGACNDIRATLNDQKR